MLSTTRGVAVAAVLMTVAVTATSTQVAAAPSNFTYSYLHNWVSSSDGQNHFTMCEFANFTVANVGPGVPAQPLEVVGGGKPIDMRTPSKFELGAFPVGFAPSTSYHHDPVPQFVTIIKGTAFWALSDGTKMLLKPGDIYFGEGQHGSVGHVSGNAGDEEVVMTIVQYASWEPTTDRPCWLK